MNEMTTVYPLTQSQLLFWTGQRMHPDVPLYNMIFAFELQGTIAAEHFQRAFSELIRQSDTLRTVFDLQDGQVVQRVLPALPYTSEYLDLSAEADPDGAFEQWLAQRKPTVFDLSERLFESCLVRLSEQRSVWYFNIHHLLIDAWAVSLLYQRMALLYHRSANGGSLSEQPLPAFREYVQFEAASREALATKERPDYLSRPARPFPAMYGRASTHGQTGSVRIAVDLGPERSDRIRQLVTEKDLRSWTPHLSIFNVFATVLFAYLYRVSGQRELAIGTPAHNRSTPQFKQTPGVFIELFPLLAEVGEADSFRTLMDRVKIESNQFLRYALPGATTAAISRSFSVVLNYITATFPDFGGIPKRMQWVHPDHIDAGHHLRLQVHDYDDTGSIQLHFDYNTGVFDPALIDVAPGHFLCLLDAFLNDRHQPIDQPELLSIPEREHVLASSRSPLQVAPPAASLITVFEQQAAARPEAIALQEGGRSLPYRALNERANQLAHWLLAQGVGSGHRVGLYGRRSIEMVVGMWGILKAGATFVPIPTDYPAPRLRYVLQDARVSLVLTQESLRNTLAEENEILHLCLDTEADRLTNFPSTDPTATPPLEAIAYLMYTSGSTGQPKGVMISHLALAHYIQAAQHQYVLPEHPKFPLFSSIGFDLTVTSLFLPLAVGGSLHIYPEPTTGPDLAILDVIDDNQIEVLKLTPSHLGLIRDRDFRHSQIQTLIVGGEDFKTELARHIQSILPQSVLIYNEYGPTEATVGCVVHQYDPATDAGTSVSIGRPLANTRAYVLDARLRLLPPGVEGELYIAGAGLATGYWNQPSLTEERFVEHPYEPGTLLYRTGDRARLNARGRIDYLGRIDQQVKIGGRRIELGEIEAVLAAHPAISEAVVALRKRPTREKPEEDLIHCKECGLPSNYPTADIDASGVCAFCRSFETYQENAERYFRTMDDLRAHFRTDQLPADREYDCLVLLSGGKDSTYALAQMVELGLNVLTFTLDNGYISEQAKDNVRRVVDALGVDHVFGSTPAMNAIFVDSLQRHKNVCDGCFKTIYTLSIQLALKKRIPYIVTGLSRGQFFETRLTEELFKKEEVDIDGIDQIILDARKSYHRADDAVGQLLDVSVFEQDDVFERVRFIDFYRYCDASLDDMLAYLNEKLPWVRPSDTGRSTNCLINAAGIFVHKQQRGYSNYAFPYSWDVRLGHKQREAALEEINESIDEQEVRRMLEEIGYPETEGEELLVAYFVADTPILEASLRSYLKEQLPFYMIPTRFVPLETLPLTPNGKVDRRGLPDPEHSDSTPDSKYVAPRGEIEELLAAIWEEVLLVERVSVHDNFLALGGNSLAAIRLMARINEALEMDLPVNRMFEYPTIAELGAHIEAIILALLEER